MSSLSLNFELWLAMVEIYTSTKNRFQKKKKDEYYIQRPPLRDFTLPQILGNQEIQSGHLWIIRVEHPGQAFRGSTVDLVLATRQPVSPVATAAAEI